MRLCLCGEVFFQDGYFPVNVRTIKDGDFLFDIKTNPQKYTKEDTVKLMDEYEKRLDASYNKIQVIHSYDEEVANRICYTLYMLILQSIKL